MNTQLNLKRALMIICLGLLLVNYAQSGSCTQDKGCQDGQISMSMSFGSHDVCGQCQDADSIRRPVKMCPAGMKFDAVLGPCIPERRKPVKMMDQWGNCEDDSDCPDDEFCSLQDDQCDWRRPVKMSGEECPPQHGCRRARKALIFLQDD